VRFVPLPYRPEGGCSPSCLLPFFGAVLLSGAFLGWLASTLGQFCYLILLFPLGMGMALACLVGAAVRWAQVRNPTLAALAGSVGGTLAVLTMHQCDYQHTRRLLASPSAGVPARIPAVVRQRLAVEDTLRGYLDAAAQVGLTVCDRSDAGFNLGYLGTYAYWGVELAVVAGLALFGGRAAAVRPFCAACRSWKGERHLGTVPDSGDVLSLMRRGDLSALGLGGSLAGRGSVLLSVASCGHCGAEAPVDVRLERVSAGKGGPPGEVVHFTYPGEALPVLEQVFLGAARRGN
jgi:hypothetical protein